MSKLRKINSERLKLFGLFLANCQKMKYKTTRSDLIAFSLGITIIIFLKLVWICGRFEVAVLQQINLFQLIKRI